MTSMAGLPTRPYAKWFWEGMKVIGASAIASLIALQLAITRQDEQIRQIRVDIDRMRAEGERLHDFAQRDREALTKEVRGVLDAIHAHEVDSLRRQLGNGVGDYGIPQP